MVVVYAPLTNYLAPEVAEGLTAQGLFGDTVATLATAWQNLCDQWDGLVSGARRLPEGELNQNVSGEWSFIQTVRHLIFVIDTWFGEIIRGRTKPHHPWGIPPDFNVAVAPDLGLVLDARPSLAEVIPVWEEHRAEVREFLERLTDGDLHRVCAARGGQFLVVGALQTLVSETGAHLRFATRDLGALEAPAS